MKYGKFVGWSIISMLAFALLSEITGSATDATYELLGLGIWIFGVWASILLIKHGE